jgi:hypothetical protein
MLNCRRKHFGRILLLADISIKTNSLHITPFEWLKSDSSLCLDSKRTMVQVEQTKMSQIMTGSIWILFHKQETLKTYIEHICCLHGRVPTPRPFLDNAVHPIRRTSTNFISSTRWCN